MKVILVTDLDLWSMGNGKGGEAFTRTVSKYKEMGDEVFLVSDVINNKDTDLLSKDHNIVVQPSFFKKWIMTRKIGFIFRHFDHKIENKRFEKKIETLLNEKGTNEVVLYAYEIFGVETCKRLSQKYGIPFVSRFQGTSMINFKYSNLNKVLRYPHFQALKTESNLVIMTDDGTKGDIILDKVGNHSNRLFLKNGLELRENKIYERLMQCDRIEIRREIGVDDDETMFLTVSRLTGWKRVDRAIKGFASFLEKRGNGKLVIVGDGDQRSFLKSLASKLGIENNVIFAGAVKHEEVYNYMIASDVFLSLFDLSNVGNPLLEAMTVGKCIVTLDVGDTKSVINGKNGILLTESDLCNLGSILFDISKCDEMRKKYGDCARKYAVDHFYTWENRMDLEYQEVTKLINI